MFSDKDNGASYKGKVPMNPLKLIKKTDADDRFPNPQYPGPTITRPTISMPSGKPKILDFSKHGTRSIYSHAISNKNENVSKKGM